MIVLDLYSEIIPLYNYTKSYYGHPFIWCMLHNFGGTVAMYGAVESINQVMTSVRLSSCVCVCVSVCLCLRLSVCLCMYVCVCVCV